MRRCFLTKVRLIAFYYSPVIFMLFSVDLFDFKWSYAISTNVKSHFLVSFLCKTIFAVRQDRYEYYEDYEDLETVLFDDLETVPE